MRKHVDVPQASEIFGLSEYAIRKGIRERRYPHIRTGLGSGKILIDVELLEEYLRQEAEDNVSSGGCTITGANVIRYGQIRRVVE